MSVLLVGLAQAADVLGQGQPAESVNSGLWLPWLGAGLFGALTIGCLMGLVTVIRRRRPSSRRDD